MVQLNIYINNFIINSILTTSIFNLYLVTDNRLRNPVGEIARNPVTDKFEKPVIY
jgi:hypothetical protein